jgi:hypothetical protein
MNIAVLWSITSCSFLEVHRRWEEPNAFLKVENRTFPEYRLMTHFTVGFVSTLKLALKKCFNEYAQFVNNMHAYKILCT